MPLPLYVRTGTIAPREIAAAGSHAIDGVLAGDAELSVHSLSGEALVLGAFQRATANDARPLVRRVSGGPSVAVGKGTIYLVLSLSQSQALTSCDAPKLVNRYVRPLLRALTKLGATAHYFGRDWVSVMHRPAGEVVFAHDAETGRSVVEAFIAVSTPFERAPRASFLGKEPGTLETITGRRFEMEKLIDGIVGAYLSAYDRERKDLGPLPPSKIAEPVRDPPWAATREEAIGEIGAGLDAGGKLRVGGDLLASRDAIANLEAHLAIAKKRADRSEISRIVSQSLAAPGVVLDGVRSLESIADVISRA
jgi:hypothetical protein